MRNKTTYISDVKALHVWVDAAMGSKATPDDVDNVVYQIHMMYDHPAWGADWTKFLAEIDVWVLQTLK